MVTALDEAENALKQLHTYIGITVTTAERIVAERLYNKAMQKLEQARQHQQNQVLQELRVIEEKLDILKDVSSTTLFEVQSAKGATLVRLS
jgi:uncharacterized protein Yka (UPF0111/DUF47 family)